jgi:acyl-CoA synthetase (AMP-forming)/AMP-acid ligase II
MTEYWSQPAKTGETIRDGWLYSGDIVRADEDGYLYYFGRKNLNVYGIEPHGWCKLYNVLAVMNLLRPPMTSKIANAFECKK